MLTIIPEKIGRYEIIRPIGKGGFATVFLGRDPYINRAVAIKASEREESKEHEKMLSRLFQEAEAAGNLLHPNIVTIYDVGIHEDLYYIAMEYIEGTTLHKYSIPENLMPLADSIDVIIKMCHALDYAHQRDIIHRDVKPTNVLLGTKGEAKLADFGLACVAEHASKENHVVGTPSYMPPEQIKGEGSSPQSDIFSLGVILYQIACGHKPWDAQGSLEMRHKIVSEPHVPLSIRNSELPAQLVAITDRALSKKPADRYPCAFDMARDLESVLTSSTPMDGKLAERIRHLQSLNFFEGFTYEENARLLNIGTWLTHKNGDTIIHEDDRGDSFYAMVAGGADVTVGGKKMGSITRGDSFGEMSFLLQRKRSATITATSDCELLRLNPKKIDVLPKDLQIKLYRLFARVIAGFLLKAEGKE